MDTEVLRLNKLLRRFDRELFAQRSPYGVVQVFQKRFVWRNLEFDGVNLLYPEPAANLVFSLTEDWSTKSPVAAWGYEPLYQKLREISLERQDELLRELYKSEDKARELERKDRLNKFEGLAEEAHAVFKKTLSDVNTSGMDMSKDVRRKIDRSIKWQ